jgi:hypothetical protein
MQIPCVVFLPQNHEDRIRLLEDVFGSEVKVAILKKFKLDAKEPKVFQQDLMKELPFSNKTIILHIGELVNLNVLNEGMEKKKNWQKYLTINPKMEWLILLFQDPQMLTEEKFRESITDFTLKYLKRVRELIDKGKLDKEKVFEVLAD